MSKLDKLYYIDGMDLHQVFGVNVESGSDELLRIPKRKESTTFNWRDEDGIDIDLSRTFFEARDFTLKCWIKATSKAAFFQKYNALITQLRKPNARRLSISRHAKDYYVVYKEDANANSFLFTVIEGVRYVKFSLSFTEIKPDFGNQPTFIIEETGHFIIT